MEDVVIAASSDDNYIKYFSVLLGSIKSSASKNRKYKILLLSDKVKLINRLLLKYQLFLFPNIELVFVEMKDISKKFKFKIAEHWTKETFYRLFLPQIISYDKVLYLDVDMIVLRDVADLYDINVEDYYLGATFNFAHCYAANNGLVDRGYLIPEYFKDVLGIDDIYDYFNAGMSLMNLKKMKEDKLEEKFWEELNSDVEYLLVDQDILNKVCHNNYLKLPSKWNIYDMFSPLNAKESVARDFEEAINDPYIVHFAGGHKRKVWHNKSLKHAEKWWNLAHKTPFLLNILYEYWKFNLLLKISRLLSAQWEKYLWL